MNAVSAQTISRNVVFGGRGFLGSALVRALINAGERVLVVDKPYRADSGVLSSYGELVEFLPASTPSDPAALGALRPDDTLFYLWSGGELNTRAEDLGTLLQKILEPATKVLAAASRAGIRQVVFASSGGTLYGPSSCGNLREDQPVHAINTYGMLKVALEQMLSVFRAQSGLPYTVLRIANAYGPGAQHSPRQNLIANLCRCAYQGVPFTIWGDGSTVRDYVYVDDVAYAFLLTKAARPDSAVFNIGTSRGTSVLEITRLVESVAGTRMDLRFEAARRCDVASSVLDASKAWRELCWKARIPLETGILRTWRRTVSVDDPLAANRGEQWLNMGIGTNH